MTIPPPPSASSASVRAVMQSNGASATKPEAAIRKALHASGLRFRKNLGLDACGRRVRPDIVFTRTRLAVFVDGCFWHCCPEHGAVPATNRGYWAAKLARNVERDGEVDQALRAAGWDVLRIWEHTRAADAVGIVRRQLAASMDRRVVARNPKADASGLGSRS
jgi:DNA mismatch endonuclease (patch repair protein)